MDRKFCNLRCNWLTAVVIVVTVVFLSSPAFGEDDHSGHEHKMGMQMKNDGMKMGKKMMQMHGQHGDHDMDNSKSISMSPELRKHMSEMYSKMGECMKTNVSIEECQKKVMVNCPVVKELGFCPLMGGMAQMKKGESSS